MFTHNPQKNLGFTLLELSMVLVIISLIMGGMFVGKSLVRSAKLRETIGQYDRYVKAIKEFQDKYQALPGDFMGAETLWGTDARANGGSCSSTNTSTTVQAATCNGNGDGRIGSSTTGGVQTNSQEWFRAWQHLANAGVIEEKFTGVKGSGGVLEAKVGVNIPAARIAPAGWTLAYWLYPTASTSYWGDQYGHVLYLGSEVAAAASTAVAFFPSEAQDIDDKIDDGKPGRGIVRARRLALEANCTTGDDGTATNASQDATTYKISYTTALACSPYFVLGF